MELVAPTLPGKYYKFSLEKPPIEFLVSSHRAPFVLFHMPNPGGQTQVVAPEPTTAMDVVQTPADAPNDLAAASEMTPDDLLEEVKGQIEHLSLTGGAATNKVTCKLNAGSLLLLMAVSVIEGAGAGEDVGPLERALAFKTRGNQHLSAGELSSALLLYSEAIALLEDHVPRDDEALAMLLCNRALAFLKIRRPDTALVDAQRARALGGGKAHFRCAEALSGLGRFGEALSAYKAALASLEVGVNADTVRGKIEELQRFTSDLRGNYRKQVARAPQAAHGGKEEVGAFCIIDPDSGDKLQWMGGKGLCQVAEGVMAAANFGNWPGILAEEGRLEELLENQSDATCVLLLDVFRKAHLHVGGFDVGCALNNHALKAVALEKRRIDLLGKLQRFRDQGHCINPLFFSVRGIEVRGFR